MGIVEDIQNTVSEIKETYDENKPGTYEHPETGEEVEIQGSAPIFATAIGGPITKAPTAGRYIAQYGDDVLKGAGALAGAAGATIGFNELTAESGESGYQNDKSVEQEMAEEMGTATYSEGGGGDPDDFTNDRSTEDTRPWYTQLKVKLAGLLSTFGLGFLLGESDGNGGPLDEFGDKVKLIAYGLFAMALAYTFGQLFNINVGDSNS